MKKIFLWIGLIICSIVICSCEEDIEKPAEKETYTITYDLDEGITKTELIREFKENEVISLPNCEKTGYDFIGWFENDEKVESIGNRNYNLKAKYQIKVYTISFYSDEGVLYESKEYEYGKKIEEYKDPIKESSEQYDYEFANWDKEFTIAQSDLDIYAIFNAIVKETKYTVNIYCNNKIINTQKVSEGGYVDLDKIEYTNIQKYRYEVEALYLDEKMETVFNFKRRIAADTDLYATIKMYPKQGSLSGRKVSILGDSISTFYDVNSEVNSYYGGTNEFYYPLYSKTVKEYTKTWWWLTIEKTKTVLGINNSWSGSTCGNWGNDSSVQPAMNNTRINTLGENGDPDIIIINIGTNDIVNDFDDKTNENNYKIMLERIIKKYPLAHIFCLNLGYSAYQGYSYTNEKREAYNSMIDRLSDKYDINVIDIAEVQTIDTYSLMLGDSLHPDEKGMSMISETVYLQIATYFAGIEYNK